MTKCIIDTAYFNILELDGIFACGKVKADKYEKFLKVPYKYSDGLDAYCIVPAGYENELLEDNNPKYMICIYGSETFYKYFVCGYKYLGINDYDYKERGNLKSKIIDSILSLNDKKKDDLLDKLYEVNDKAVYINYGDITIDKEYLSCGNIDDLNTSYNRIIDFIKEGNNNDKC